MSDNQAGWARVAETGDVAAGEVLGVMIGDLDIAIFNLGEGEYRATSNLCTHEYARLSDGWAEDGTIECPLHGGVFDVRTGKGLCPPIDRDLKTFEVRVENEVIFVRLSDDSGPS